MKLLQDFCHCSDASVNSAGCVLVFEYIDKLLCLNLLIQRVRLMANVLTLLQSGLRNEKSRLKSLITLSCLHSFVRLLVTDTLAQTWKLTWHKLEPLSWSYTCTHGCALSLPLFISLSCYLECFFPLLVSFCSRSRTLCLRLILSLPLSHPFLHRHSLAVFLSFTLCWQ